jgi:energy-coupling factor transporter ATP-binding protein EcfA2
VFLFDEPLSNLDAALRGQMRIEIAKLHRDLGATTIYVTHDQVEAMTLADRSWCCATADRAGRHAAGAVRPAGQPVRRPVHRLAAGAARPCYRKFWKKPVSSTFCTPTPVVMSAVIWWTPTPTPSTGC